MRLYQQPKRLRRYVGGNWGRNVWQKVVGTAKKFAQSSFGKKVGKLARKKILQIGSSAIDRMLSGGDTKATIKRAASEVSSQLPVSSQKRFKRSVLGKKSKNQKKRGGVLLYRLNKRPRKRKKLGPLLYRLNTAKAKKRRKPNYWDNIRFKLSRKRKSSRPRRRRKGGRPKGRKKGRKKARKKSRKRARAPKRKTKRGKKGKVKKRRRRLASLRQRPKTIFER